MKTTCKINLSDKNVMSILFVFIICVALLDFSVIAKSLVEQNNRFEDFYSSKNIFYVQLHRMRETEDKVENVSAFDVNAHLFYKKGQCDNIKMEQLHFSDGIFSSIYFLVCEKKYQSVSFDIYDRSSHSSVIDETYPTQICNFGTYGLRFESSWTYTYSKSKWGEPNLNSRQFNDLFIKQHTRDDEENYIQGAFSFPNISVSFRNLLAEVDQLRSIPASNSYLPGKNAWEQWTAIEDEFIKKGITHVA